MDDIVTNILLVFLPLIVIITVYKLYKSPIIHFGQRRLSGPLMLAEKSLTTSSSLTHCQSPDCHRCTNNLETLQTALTKLSYHSQENHAKDIHNISVDLKKCIDRLKHPEKYVGDKLSSNKVRTSSPVVFKMSGLREQELWSINDFPALQILETHFKQIRLEFSNLYKSPLPETKSLWKSNSTGSGKWEIVQLIDQGRMRKAAELCPLTMEVLKKIPYFIRSNILGDASFSVVHPNTHIETHCGTTNCRIRCHLGLEIPQDDCTLQVGDKTCHWQEGKVICFNDAFPHSVHHKGSDISNMRVVFILDIWHPDITEVQKDILNYVFSA